MRISHFVDRKVLNDAVLVKKLGLSIFSHHLKLSKGIGKPSDLMVICYQYGNTTNDRLWSKTLFELKSKYPLTTLFQQ